MGKKADIQVPPGHSAAIVYDTDLLDSPSSQVYRNLGGSRINGIVQKLPHHTGCAVYNLAGSNLGCCHLIKNMDPSFFAHIYSLTDTGQISTL